jgi:hypothetical protein
MPAALAAWLLRVQRTLESYRKQEHLFGLCPHHELQRNCVVHGQLWICIAGLCQDPDRSQDPISSRFVKYSGSAFHNPESRRLEKFAYRDPGEPPEVGSVQEAGVLVSELPRIQSRLHTPMLRIWNTSDDAASIADLVAYLLEQLPRVSKMLQSVAEYPAVRRKEAIESILVQVFDRAIQNAVAVSFACSRIFRVYFDARVVAIRGQVLEGPGKSPRTASNLYQASRLPGDQGKQVGIGDFVSRSLLHVSLSSSPQQSQATPSSHAIFRDIFDNHLSRRAIQNCRHSHVLPKCATFPFEGPFVPLAGKSRDHNDEN